MPTAESATRPSGAAAPAPGAGPGDEPVATRWLVVLLAVAAGARLLALSRQSFWYDEAVSVVLAGHPLADLLSGRARDLGNPPLYPALLRLWTLVFGTSDPAVRSLSAVLGAATVPLVYDAGRRVLGGRAALAGAALLALAPFHLQMAQEARTYTLLTLCGVAATAALLRALETPQRWRWWVLMGVATAAMVLSHYFGLFLAVALAGYVLVARWRDRPVLARAAAGFALAAALFSFWLPSLFGQVTVKGNLARSAESWHLHLFATPLVFGVGSTLVWKDSASGWRLAAGAVAVVLFAGTLLLGLWRTRRRPGFGLLLAWLIVPVALPAVVSLLASPLYNTRYVILASVPFYLFVGAGLVSLRPLPGAIVGAALLLVMVTSQLSYLNRTVKHDWRGAAAEIEAELQPDDVLLFEADYNETAYAHYARMAGPRLRLLDSPANAAGEPPDGGGPRLYGAVHEGAATVDLTHIIRQHRRAWLILSDARPEAAARVKKFFSNWRLNRSNDLKGISISLYEH